MKIKPLFDKVVLKATEVEETTQSGFILTSASQENIQALKLKSTVKNTQSYVRTKFSQ